LDYVLVEPVVEESAEKNVESASESGEDEVELVMENSSSI